jgi:hypothetical protein
MKCKLFIVLCLTAELVLAAKPTLSPRSAQLSDPTAPANTPSPAIATPALSHHSALDEPLGEVYVAGTTWYDLQSQGPTGQRVVVDDEQWVNVVWTGSASNSGTRHIGWNVWLPDSNGFLYGDTAFHWLVLRASLPTVGVLPDGVTLLAARSGPGIEVCMDFAPGSGAFTCTDPFGSGDWYGPRLTNIGDQLHMVLVEMAAAGYGSPLSYSRGTIQYDGDGHPATADFSAPVNLDTVNYLGYDIAASHRSGRMAIGYLRPGQPFDESELTFDGENLFVRTSDDTGLTWGAPRSVTEFAPGDIACLAETQDTLVCNRDTLRAWLDLDMLFDASDSLHAVFSTMGFYTFTPDGPAGYVYALIWHWSESTNHFSLIANGYYGNRNVALGVTNLMVQRPSIAIDTTTGYLYCAYMRFDSLYYSEGGNPVADIEVSVSTDGGERWSVGTNVTHGSRGGAPCAAGDCEHFRDPCLAEFVTNGIVHLTYLLDHDAGTVAFDEGTATLNEFIYQRIPVDSIPTTPLMPQYPLHWDSTGFYAAAQDRSHPVPRAFTFDPVYPNPFNSSVNLQYSLAHDAHVTLRVFDITGRTVELLVDRQVPAGEHSVTWAPRVASGLYFARLESAGQSRVQKLVLLR